MSQDEFGEVAYEVVGEAFSLHKKLGRLFDERIYQRALARRLGQRAEVEFPVRVWHGEFETHYAIDLVVHGGAIFELKAVDSLTDAHRSQLLHYLMLTETSHGKLINFRPDKVEHEFVNTSLMRDDRALFSINTDAWDAAPAGSHRLHDVVIALVADWGTGLSLPLYEQAVIYLLGGEEEVIRPVDVVIDGVPHGQEMVGMLDSATAFWLSCIKDDDLPFFEAHVRRLLRHTSLSCIQWINIFRHAVAFTTLT